MLEAALFGTFGRLAVIAAVGMAIAYEVFTRARRRASRSRRVRARLIQLGGVGAVLGIAIAIRLPHYLPSNPESPALILFLLLSWILGGGVCFLSLATLAGAIVAQQAHEQ
jgi:hypothetical protein